MFFQLHINYIYRLRKLSLKENYILQIFARSHCELAGSRHESSISQFTLRNVLQLHIYASYINRLRKLSPKENYIPQIFVRSRRELDGSRHESSISQFTL